MSILSIDSFESVLLDNDTITYEVKAIIEDAVVTLPAVYNPPEVASPAEYSSAYCETIIKQDELEGVEELDLKKIAGILTDPTDRSEINEAVLDNANWWIQTEYSIGDYL